MFSHDDDTDDIKAARVVELAAIEVWIAEHKRHREEDEGGEGTQGAAAAGGRQGTEGGAASAEQ